MERLIFLLVFFSPYLKWLWSWSFYKWLHKVLFEIEWWKVDKIRNFKALKYICIQPVLNLIWDSKSIKAAILFNSFVLERPTFCFYSSYGQLYFLCKNLAISMPQNSITHFKIYCFLNSLSAAQSPHTFFVRVVQHFLASNSSLRGAS